MMSDSDRAILRGVNQNADRDSGACSRGSRSQGRTLRSWCDYIYRFNQHQRDEWVAERAAEVPPGLRVLDVGAGHCPYAPLFAHCEYKTHDFLQIPNEVSRYGGYGRIDYVSDITAIPVPERSFDVILCTEVLEHVPDPSGAVREMARILRPGGRLLLTAPLMSALHQEPYHFFGGFTPYWYMQTLRETGFSKIEISPNGGYFRQLGQEVLRLCKTLAPWKGGRWRWFPLWTASLPLAVLLPPVAARADKTGLIKGFTVGYHVQAQKS